MNQVESSFDPRLTRIQRGALVVGGLGLIVTAAGAFISQEQFFQAYLWGFLFWVHVALGCLAAVMLHHVVGGAWSYGIRRFMESAAMTLPLMAVLFIPIAFGLPELYLWARPEAVADSALLQHKQPYLNIPFFLGRTVLYFIIWVGLAFFLNRWSLQADETPEPFNRRLKTASTLGLILYLLTATFAGFDWMMSLEPKWFSSIYGLIFVAGQALVAIALAIVLVYLAAKEQLFSKWVSSARYNDLGNFLLAFVAFWAYIAFAQYLIIWSGSLPEEVTWYIRRTENGWQWLAFVLIFFHFSLPFLLLLSRRIKRQAQVLTAIAVFVILMRFVDLFWLVMPAFRAEHLYLHWLDIAALLGIGGLWIAFFAWQLKGKRLLAGHDSRIEEVPAYD